MVTLYNVIDIRTNRHYTVAVISKRNKKYFLPATDEAAE